MKPRVPSLTPHLVCDDAAAAIDFYKRAFGAEETLRVPAPDGRLLHASLTIDGSPLMLVDSNPDWNARSPKALGGTPASLHLYVADADAVAARAVAAGATVIMPVGDSFWGDRYGLVEDPFGHQWSIATPQREMSGEEIAEAAREALARPCGEPAKTEA